MKKLAFIDTNIFLNTDDNREPSKKALATQLVTEHLHAGTALISIQVLQQYFAAATRKLGLTPEFAQRKVELMSRMRMVRLNEWDVVSAIEFHRLHPISFWDALILQAARLGGAESILTEDLHHGAVLGGVRIVNPFAEYS